MKRILFLISTLAISAFTANAQCDPEAHDWGTEPFGVSPNPAVGENFAPAYINMPYADVVYVKCPSNAQDIDPTFPSFAIDSISLDSITIFNGLVDVQLSTIGLELTCNNNDDSPNPCMFLPTQAYCGDIQGTPTVSGTFDVKIFITAYFNFLGPQELPYSFEGYTLVIDGPDSVKEEEAMISQLQNSPNPASNYTNINYSLNKAEDVQFTVNNLVGKVVMTKTLKGRRGDNTFRLETGELETGVYLYSVQMGDKKLTRRLIIQQ